jgi:alpha-L-rhamnosidase
MKYRFYFIVIFVFCSAVTTTTSASLKPDVLTCEYIKNPLGIDIQKPRLSWTLTSDQRNQFQKAYQVLVSDNLYDIHKNKGNVWSSGKITSSQNLHVEYNGSPLKSFIKYYWIVRVYNQKGESSPWSQPATFETAMLNPSDWQAQWIGDERRQFERDEDFYKDDPMPLLRKTFPTKKSVASARLYISGLGYYEAFLNGKKIGDRWLDPGFTKYSKQDLYSTYDISSMLRNGTNTAGIMLGNGWWNPLPLRLFGRFNLRDVQQTGRPCVKAQIRIVYNDGSSETIVTDNSWQTAAGPVIRNSVYLGEHYDARLEKSFESEAARDWKPATIVQGPAGILTARIQPPIRVTKVVRPVRITQAGKDTFIVDMGQIFGGVARIKVQGAPGTKITLRHGEDTFKNGSLNYLTTVAGQIKEQFHLSGGPGAPKTAWQEDSYTAKGSGMEIWSPRFTFHSFRYVEITGWPGKPTLNDIEGLRMNSDVQTDGTFSCSNDMFNQLNEVIKWTFLSNIFSVQSDCPGREKMGYGGDMVATSQAFIYNFDMANFYRKTVQDFANDQQPDGGITEIAPYTGIADRGYGGESGPLGWELAFPYLQKQLYDYYGDKRIIEQNYNAFKKQMNFLQTKAINGLFHWDISDHEALDPKPEAFTASAFYYHHALLATEFAGILGKKEDSLQYAKLARDIKDAIVKKYWVPRTGRFDNATQSAQIFALYYNFSPVKDSSLQVLMDEFARHDMHVSTGIFATKMLFDVLRENDRNNVAYTVADQRDFPGWGNMLAKGATTLWETWAYPDNAPSQNHPMFGSVSEWFYKSILGINAAVPGFEKIIIKPQPAGNLSWAKGSYNSVHGNIVSAWRKDKNVFTLHIVIPANTTAEVWVPAREKGTITENGKPVSAVEGVKLLGYEKGYAILATGSGEYNFSANAIFK